MKNHSKKALALFLALSLSLGLTACGSAKDSASGDTSGGTVTTLKVGATPSPHGDILKVVQPILENGDGLG